MARRGRIAVGVSLLALVVTVLVSVQLPAAAPRTATREGRSPAGIASSPVASGVTIRLAARLDTLRHELDAIEAQLADLTAAVSDLAESVPVVAPEVLQARRELARQADEAQGAALRPSRAAAASAATPSALVRPLQTVNGAMRSKDEYVAALLRALSTAQRQDVSLRTLPDTARLLRSELEQRTNDLERLRSDATRAISLQDGAASSILDPVRVEIGRTQGLLALARRADIDLRVESIRLRTRRDALLGQMERAEARGAVLHEAMARVEDFVADAFPGLVFSAATPVVAAVLHVCPVDQPHSYTDDFGAPRWAGGYHPHEGNDIFAPEGTPIRAPFDGLAVATPNTLGGRAVTVYGEAGYVYNAHLSAYGKLGQVTTGTIIGYVGNSGDATNSAPHDHFEWHPGNRSAVDPFPYLNAVCLLPNVAPPS